MITIQFIIFLLLIFLYHIFILCSIYCIVEIQFKESMTWRLWLTSYKTVSGAAWPCVSGPVTSNPSSSSDTQIRHICPEGLYSFCSSHGSQTHPYNTHQWTFLQSYSCYRWYVEVHIYTPQTSCHPWQIDCLCVPWWYSRVHLSLLCSRA